MIIVFYEHTTDKMLSVSYVVMIVISTIAVAVFGNGAVFALIVMKEWDKLPQELEISGYLKKESLNFDGLHIYMTLAMTNDGKSEELTY